MQSSGPSAPHNPLPAGMPVARICPVDIQKEGVSYSCWMSTRADKSGVLQGTLDLMVLRTLETLGPQHGFGLAQRIQQISDGALALNQGTLYPALLRLEQRGWIRGKWGASTNNRRARFYELTRAGRKQIAQEAGDWARTVSIVERFLRPAPEEE